MRRMFLMSKKQEDIGPFDVWDGTVGAFPSLDEDGWYVINTCSELAAVAKDVNEGSAPRGASRKYRLASNLDLNNINWSPIGRGNLGGVQTFTSNFDGAGYIIKNLKVVDPGNAGLFGTIENIDDMGAVRVSGITIYGTIGSISRTPIHAGGIAAISAMYIIENCISYCYIRGR